ncbi:helix-turn-helix domain-containing protein [Caenimonas koreensis]|uniref:helix-turn-helix domain-containing protein n=1 Tax=Caenimonas koreensis TaxID=367474 RepID=UPI003783688F
MSDEWGQQGDAIVAAPSAGPTAGALLRQARESAGLHIAALAVALKVPVRKLEALEDDRYDLMTDSVFVRGLAASVCRTLKIDPQPVLERLPQRTAPRLVRDDDGINTPFRAPGDGPPAKWTAHLTRPVYIAVVALLLGALALVLFPVSIHDDWLKDAVKVEAPAPVFIPAPADPAPVSGPVAVPAPAPAAVAPAVAIAPAAAPEAAPAAAPAPASSSVAASSPPVATGLLVIRATGPSWVEITDAKGESPVRRMLAAGESAVANGPLPIHVIVGRSDLTEVSVRGKPFDIKPYARADNLARFDVK